MDENTPFPHLTQNPPSRKWLSVVRSRVIDRAHVDWIVGILIRPRKTLFGISTKSEGVWFPPLLLLTLTAVFFSLAAGSLRQEAVSAGEISYPPGFEYYTPEQQAQFMQAAQATSGPIFIYLIPMTGKISAVWLSWLVVSGILHLLVTMLGGRGSTTTTVNVVAWSGVPFVLRDLIRSAYILIAHSQITMSGLSGFISSPETPLLLFLSIFLATVDLFLIWNVVLMVIGIDCATRLPRIKVVLGVLLTVIAVLGMQALSGYLLTMLSDLTVVRPFMF